MLAVYTAFGILKLEKGWDIKAGPPGPQSAAELLAARLDGEIAQRRGGLAVGAEVLSRVPDAPIEAAEAALRAAGPGVAAVAVVSGDAPAAVAGQAEAADWKGAARLAETSGRSHWVGIAPGDPRRLYVARVAGRSVLLTAQDLTRLPIEAERGAAAALATIDGRLLAAAGAGGVTQASTVREAFALPASDFRTTNQVRARRPDGSAVDVAARPVAGGALLAVAAAAPVGVVEANSQRIDGLVSLLAPLGIGIGLALLLFAQSRKAEAAQRAFVESEQRFRMAVEAARCGIWEWDLAEDQVFMSDVTGIIFGWGGGGVVAGQEVLDRVAPDHRERVRQALAHAAANGAFDVSFRVPDPQGGRSIWIDARGQGLDDAGQNGYRRIIGVALDVTEERLAQARAQQAENRLRDAIESVSEAFVLWDRSGRLLLCNRNYRNVFNLEPRVLKPGASRDQVKRFVALAIKQELPSPDGAKGLREAELNDGRWIQISERRTAEGGLVMTAADITAIKAQEEARRQNEEQLQQAVTSLERSQEQLAELARKYETEKIRAESANKAKSEFLANMSHELRTPLNAVNGFSEIMVTEMFGPLGDRRYREYAQDIHNSGQHLLALINDILDMSKIEAGKMNLKFEPMSLEEVTEDAVRLVRNRADAAGLELSVDFPFLPEIEADYRAIKQVLLNLLSNAVKFTPRGGRVTVRAEVRHDALGERARVSVQDTGIGISKQDLARLAQPFEQVESQHSKTTQGSGLGLALTKSLIELHEGVLEMESAPGEGTTVSFTLPLRRGGSAAAA
ncbi:ATPase [Caulobacter mirabilis]|uniref:histidine kinase n=2 Tax=Caulobacter mirabilis TaxID=69666 RepID=A0A2D2B3T6_9CAUL|nr:ATPase [Caulobacter mirabilis]